MNQSPFTFDTEFFPDDAREDKIDLELSGWAVTGLANEVDTEHEFKGFMSGPPGGQEDLAWSSKNEAARYGWMFLRPEMKGKDRDKLLIRKQALINPLTKRRHEAPLCGGHCLFFKDKKTRTVSRHLAKLRLSLNLQRFTRHQYRNDEPAMLRFRLQRSRESRSMHGDEFALDGTDNWIPQGAAWKAARKAEHISTCLSMITREFERDLKRACESATGLAQIGDEWGNVGWDRENECYRLQKVETLWEF